MKDSIVIIPDEVSILDILLHERKMIRFPEQEDDAIDMLSEFVNELTNISDDIPETGIIPFLIRRIAETDELLTAQINEILHDPNFQKLESSWRGLYYFVMNTETGKQLRIRVLNASLEELQTDLIKAIEFDQSSLFKKFK